MGQARAAADTTAAPHPESRPLGLCLLLGAGFAALGLVPWLVTGLRLPLQNLWRSETAPDQMPRVLLPFSQYAVVLIIVVLVTGAAAAGSWCRAARPRPVGREVRAVAIGVLVVQLAAVLQTARVVQAGLSPQPASVVYLAGLVVVAAMSVLFGMIALTLIAMAPRAGALIGLGTGALALGPWLNGLLVPFGSIDSSPAIVTLFAVLRWVPPVLVGAAIAWAGLRSVGRVLAALVALALLWVVPAVTNALTAAGGSRVLARYPAELVQYAGEVFVATLTTTALVVPPILVAVVVAAAGLAGRRVLGGRQGRPERRHDGSGV